MIFVKLHAAVAAAAAADDDDDDDVDRNFKASRSKFCLCFKALASNVWPRPGLSIAGVSEV